MRRYLTIALLFLLPLGWLGGCATSRPPLRAAADIELDRYLGRWYVIANIPYFAERGKVASYVEYRRRADGRIDDLYFFRKGFDAPQQQWSGVAWVPDAADPARWRVRFVWPFTSDYVILAVAPDYRYAMVGLPSRELLWVFSREPQLDEASYRALLEIARAQGFDPAQVQRVPQMPQQLGQEGFQ